MEKMKRKHEEEIKELQALCVENTLIRHNMNNKRPILFTPTKPKPTKQPWAEHEWTIQGYNDETNKDYKPSATTTMDTIGMHSFT